MTQQQRKFLLDLIHAAFERAHSQGLESPIDLAPFGKLLRELEPGFTHQAYGHEKLLYLLRGEFHDLLHIRKDQEVDPPRYYVSIRRGPPKPAHRQQSFSHESARMSPVLDPTLVDGGLLEHYLTSLAESSARTQQRFDAIEQGLVGMQDELARSRANEIRLHLQVSELAAANKNITNRSLVEIQKRLEQSRANEVRMNDEIKGIAAAIKDLWMRK